MTEENGLSLDKSHAYFAKSLNGEVWDLLEKPKRSLSEDERMLYAAYASCYHWLHAGTSLHQQRGEWLISRVQTVLGNGEAALKHAKRCMELTMQYKRLMQDFDFAYAFEGLARAHALNKNQAKAEYYLEEARKAGEKISEKESQEFFFGDLQGGEWFGLV